MSDVENPVDIAAAREAYKKAEADLKAAGNDATKRKMALDARKKAGADIDLYKAMQGDTYHKNIIASNEKKLADSTKKLEAARSKYGEIDRKRKIAEAIIDSGNHLHFSQLNQCQEYLDEHYPEVKLTKEELEQVHAERRKYTAEHPGATVEDYKKYLEAERKKQGNIIKKERDKNIPAYKKNISLAKAALKKAEEVKAQSAAQGNGGGVDVGGGMVYDEQNQTLTKPYKDENGNTVAVATYNKNGKIQEVQFKDEKGNDQKLKADEIQKAKINIDDIKNALESGDLKKAMELLLNALLAKQNNYQQIGNGQENKPESKKEYKDEQTGVVFAVEKSGDEIKAIRMIEDKDNQLVISKEMFEKAEVNPQDIEKALKNKDFSKAAGGLYNVAEKNGIQVVAQQDPKVAVKGESIILTDASGKEFKLTEDYLRASGMKKAKAKGTMKKLSEALAIRPQPKGLDQAVATYFSGESPAPVMPKAKEGRWSVSKLNKTWLNQGTAMVGVSSGAISITVVNENGSKKKLKAEDFANYFHCDKKEGKKILKAYARALEDGAELDGVLSEIADGRSSGSKTKKKGIAEELVAETGKKAASKVKNRFNDFTTQKINDFTRGIFR